MIAARSDPNAVPRLIALLVIAGIYLAVPNARADLTRFNADDSEAYLALSYALTHGLGYTRSLVPGLYVAHTTWPPGMPTLLAPVIAAATLPIDWLAVKLTIILIGLAGIVLAWIYVHRITRSRSAADLASLLLALQPFYWLFSRMALTEVPTTAFVLLSLLLIDVVWAARRPLIWQVAAAGFVSGLGMLLRGTVFGIVFVPLAYAFGARRSDLSRGRFITLWALHGGAFCLATIAWAIRNRGIDASHLGFDGINQMRMLLAVDAVDAASPLVTPGGMLYRIIDNFIYGIVYRAPEQLLPGLWIGGFADWPGAAFLAAGLTALLGFMALPRTAAGWPITLTLVPYIGLMCIYSLGGSVRFWIPITSLLSLLVAINLGRRMASLGPSPRLLVFATGIVVYGANLGWFARDFVARPFLGDLGNMVTLFDAARGMSPPPAATLTEHGTLFTLQTGLASPSTSAALTAVPRYTHMISRDIATAYARRLPVPQGATEVLAVGAWHMYALPAPMTLGQLASQ